MSHRLQDGYLRGPQRSTLAVLVIIIMILIQIPIACRAQESASESAFIPDTLYDSIELLDNSNLTKPITFNVEGDSGEFSYSQNLTSGILSLNWTHVAGTEIDYNNSEYNRPESLEFVYFSLEFNWTNSIVPTETKVSLNFSISRTGTFQEGYDMYMLRTWLIHPNGEWIGVSRYDYVHSSPLSPELFIDGFRTEGLFTHLRETGEKAKLVVGLVPSSGFFEEEFNYPWQFYNGSVVVRFQNVNMDALFRTSTDFPSPEEPSFEITWNHEVNQNNYGALSEYYVDSSFGANGDAVILSSYMYPGSPFREYQTLTMIDSKAEIVWQKTLYLTDLKWLFVRIYDSRIYLLCSNSTEEDMVNPVLMVLQWNGAPLWNVTYEYSEDVNCGAMEIDGSGNIYIGYTIENHDCLLKLDQNGTKLWELDIGISSDISNVVLAVSEMKYIYIETYNGITLLDEDGSVQWSDSAKSHILGTVKDGSVIIYNDTTICKLSFERELLWSFDIQYKYARQWPVYLNPISIEEGNNGSIYILLGGSYLHYCSTLLEIDSEGTRLTNQTLGFGHRLYFEKDVPMFSNFHRDDTGVIYLCGNIRSGSNDYNLKNHVILSILNADTESSSFVHTSELFITSGIAGSILVGTIVIWQMNHRRRRDGDQTAPRAIGTENLTV